VALTQGLEVFGEKKSENVISPPKMATSNSYNGTIRKCSRAFQ
jgi:hypothetical protein